MIDAMKALVYKKAAQYKPTQEELAWTRRILGRQDFTDAEAAESVRCWERGKLWGKLVRGEAI